MRLIVEPSELKGRVEIPSSKSHTIRAVVIASLADGTSEIINPLISEDCQASVRACRALGAEIEMGGSWIVKGMAGKPKAPDDVIDVRNSGTTARLTIGTAALGSGYSVFTGDGSVRRRPMGSLLEALSNLGATAFSTRGNGRLPAVVKGPIRGGRTAVDGATSQFLSSLLINTPLAEGDSEITLSSLNERPYVEMTCNWLDSQCIRYEREGYLGFRMYGGQRYRPFSRRMPGDFSSATFFLSAAAIPGCDLFLEGLDMSDPQGDREVVNMLKGMGARITIEDDGIRVVGGKLEGMELDLNATPDALPALAVVGCTASGETRLVNVPQARIKETDRISVMREGLSRMGADVEELPDGLVVRGSEMKGSVVDGHEDHRVVMALAVAGLAAQGRTEVTTAEAMGATFPNFVDLMTSLGARMRLAQD